MKNLQKSTNFHKNKAGSSKIAVHILNKMKGKLIMDNRDDKKVNNISIIISGIIIAIVVLLVGMLIDFVEIKLSNNA